MYKVNPWRDPNPCDEGYDPEKDAWEDVPGSSERKKQEDYYV